LDVNASPPVYAPYDVLVHQFALSLHKKAAGFLQTFPRSYALAIR